MNCSLSDANVPLRDVLAAHSARYPRMEIADWVKLLFQSEFAGGHMIHNPADCLGFLQAEWADTPADPSAALFEPIGGGLLRLYLPPAKALHLPPEAVNAAFVQTANANRGSVDRFEQKLDLLRRLADEKAVPLDREPLERYLAEYKARGYPPVHHSDAYAAAYRPRYRVIDPAFWVATESIGGWDLAVEHVDFSPRKAQESCAGRRISSIFKRKRPCAPPSWRAHPICAVATWREG